MKDIEKFIRQACKDAVGVGRQTGRYFGVWKAQQFMLSAGDGVSIQHAIMDCYKRPALMNLLHTQAWGMLKEMKWLQLLFLAGNYPLVKSRLRYIWEAMYRAYFVEAHNDREVSGLDQDAKLRWLEGHKPRLDWRNCVQPVLKRLIPLPDKKERVFRRYCELWGELSRYIHPSEYIQTRMVDESALLVRDSFDRTWADDTLLAGRMVADMVWLALLSFYKEAIPPVAGEKLRVDYPLTSCLLRKGK